MNVDGLSLYNSLRLSTHDHTGSNSLNFVTFWQVIQSCWTMITRNTKHKTGSSERMVKQIKINLPCRLFSPRYF